MRAPETPALRRRCPAARGAVRTVTTLAAVAIAAACDASPGPVAELAAGYRAPTVESRAGGERLVINRVARERLIRYPPSDAAGRAIFVAGAVATPRAAGGSAWSDTDGGRVALFDDRGRLEALIRAAPPGERALERPLFAVEVVDALLIGEPDASTLRHTDRAAVWIEPPLPAPVAAVAAGRLIAARTVREFALGPIVASEPLLWIRDVGAAVRGIGRVTVPANAFLGELVNTGWVAADGEAIYFASALRPELVRYDARDGRRVWTSRWTPERLPDPPTLVARGGAVTPAFTELQHGVVVGPDGLVYVLAAGASDEGFTAAARLLVFATDGTLLREASVRPDDGLLVDPDGRLFAAPAASLLQPPDASERVRFAEFDLPALVRDGRVRLADHIGRPVVVNFWASWCAPCRREMPLLQALADSLPAGEAAVIGISDDVDAGAARDFAREIGVRYSLADGAGRQRHEYGYRGLPYTVVLDRQHRVAATFHGFGDDIGDIATALRSVLAEPAGPAPRLTQ